MKKMVDKIVKSLTSSETIKNLLLDTISNNKKPIILTKQIGISKQLLSYYLKQLSSKGQIRKLQKGNWEIVKGYLELTSQRKARGHAFIWRIKLKNNIENWKNRQQVLINLGIPLTHAGNTIRIIIKGKKVWLNNKSIIIFEPKSFFDSSPLETRKLAIYELIETIKTLENTIKINLGKYNFTTKREHIAWINDNLAIQCNLEGQKLKIIDKGECWMEVDNSHNEDETEFYKTPNFSAIVNSTGYNGYYNSHKKTNWKITPEFTLNAISGLVQTQTMFQENIKTHFKVLNSIEEAVNKLTEQVNKLNKK